MNRNSKRAKSPGGVVNDHRAVSITVNYVLSLAIAMLLLTGLLFAVGSFVEDQRERATRTEFRVIGQQLAAELTAADRLAQSADGGRVVVSQSLPDRVVGSGYTIEITHDPAPTVRHRYTLTLTNDDGVTVTVKFTTMTEISPTPTRVKGGEIRISYLDSDGDGEKELVVESV